LREVQGEERDEESRGGDIEEQEASDQGNVPFMRHNDVQDWQVV